MKEKQGFTLLEVVVSLAILAGGIIAILQLFPLAQQQQRIAAGRTTVATLARTELGKVRAGGIFNQAAGGTIQDYIDNWARENALVMLSQAQRAYMLYDGWRARVERVSGPFAGAGEEDVSLYRITFAVQMPDGQEEKFVTYVTEM
jgi:prepilin-type N-terminal cleavage/methylation domain-containing protein